jgi:hypothetical protein
VRRTGRRRAPRRAAPRRAGAAPPDAAPAAAASPPRRRRPRRTLPPDRPEFVLAEAQEPHLFVIRRQVRAPPGGGGGGGPSGAPRAATQGVYYILGDAGHTFQAPSLHAAVGARLRRCMHFVRTGFGRFKVCRVELWAQA